MPERPVPGASPFTAEEQELFALLLAQAGLAGDGAEAVPGPPPAASPAARRPLSAAQQRLWFLHRLEPASPAYNMPLALRLRGELDRAALALALAAVVERHEVLRTLLPEDEEGRPVPVVVAGWPAAPLPADVDLAGLPAAAAAAAERLVLGTAARRPFDLGRGPLLRAVLLRQGPAEHVLCLVLHHIAGDGWSTGILLREIVAVYAAAIAGQPSPLAPLPLQYGDFAAWQRRRLQGSELARLLAYWRQRLPAVPPPLDLPGAVRTPSRQRGSRRTWIAGGELTAALHGLARGSGATLFAVLLTALAVLLRRLAGGARGELAGAGAGDLDDLLVGAPVSGRDRLEWEGLVGCFLNTLALRCSWQGNPPVRELVRQTAGQVAEDFAHRELPFELLLEQLQPPRDLVQAPLLQVLLNMLTYPVARLQAPGLELTAVALPEEFAKLDLTLYVEPVGDDLKLDLVYDADRLDPAQMDHLLPQLAHLLRQMADAPATRVGDLSLVTASAAALLPDPAAALRGEWRGGPLAHLLAHAARAPAQVAVADASGSFDYAELAARSAALAGQLRAAGVARGEVVAVYGWRCGALAWALTGVLRAGAAFVILDPAHPAERLQAVLRQARPRGWVQLAQAGAPPVAVAELAAALAGERRLELPPIGEHADARFLGRRPDTAGAETGGDDLDAAAADDLAYVAFTSGSSGQPKGVLGTHAPLAHFLAWYEGELALGPRDRFSLLSGLAHDPLLRDVFAPLWAGATLVAPDPDDLLVPGGLAAWLAEQAITVAHMTPSLARVLAAGATPGRSLPALRCLCFGGESVSWRDLARLRPLLPAAEWVGFYGATETPQAMGFWRPSRPAGGGDGGDPPRGAGPPLGRGIEGVQLWVVTAGGRLAGIGERGEIHVRTPYLARGYLEDQPLTRERFLANWLTGSLADRVYRTGDLGRFLPDGQVEFLGRADRQLKVRGHRIEPAEVEAALHDVAGVRQALVTTCPGGPGAETETLLVAYVVLDPRRPPGAEELRARLRSRLPEAMVPTRFVPLDVLPLTPAGKVDVRALPSPAAAAAAAGGGTRASRPPRTAAERVLSTIWADVLGLTEVGAEDDFFTLGGDSIRMVQVLARARRHGLALSLAQFFAHPTVAALARAAGDAGDAAAAGPGAPAAAAAGAVGQGEDGEDVEAIYDLSPGQRGLLFPSSHQRETGAYLTQTSWVLTGRLDRAAFAAAWRHVLLRHPVLRSSFRWRGLDRPVQAVHRQVPLPLLHVDWRRLGAAGPGAGGEAQLPRLLDLDRRRGLDPSRAPLFRLLLIQDTAERHQLIWTRHHLLLDGWSVGLVLRDVIETYRALSERRRPALPPARPFADFIAWLAVRDRAAAESFWRRSLAGFADPTPLPLARHGGAAAGPGAATGQAVLQLAPALAESLRALAAARRLTLHSVLMGAWAALLSRLADQADVVVGTTVAGRPVELPGVESIAGMLANVVPVRCLARTGERAAAFLAQVQETFVELLAHSWLALAEVQRCSAVPATRRLFDTLLAFESFPGGLDAAASLRELALARGISRERPGLPMNLAIEPPAGFAADRLALRLLYDPSRCEALAMRRLLGYFANLLDSLAAAPDRRLDELELLGEAERHQLTLGWNESGQGPGPWLGPGGARTVVDLVLAEARRRPEAPAVVAAAERLTYGDLERLSARVAHQLAAHGVGPEVPVALLAERSAGVIVALLAILRAGGAYLPLDPDEAPERIVALLADSAAPLLVAGERLLARRPELQAALASPPATPPRRVGLEALLAAAREAGGGDPAPAGRPLPDNLAYLTYTSGSTGQPKAVAVAHRGVARLVAGSSCFELGPREVTLHLAPLAFDASTFEIWGALARGGCVALPAPGPVSLAELGYAITRFGVTTLFLTTGLFHAMVDRRIGALAPLRQLLAGGEVLAPAQVRRVLAELPRTEFVACYGPTENTTFTSCHRLAGGEPLVTPTVPIGRPVAGTRTYALDRALRLVPVGATGELHTGGDGLARGYQGRPDWTAERFVPDPFGGAGERLYRTGDLVRQLPDGSFEFAGRRDGQVKVRGFRVEPGEIEATLRRHQAIRQAAVVARRDGGRATALVAFVAGETPGSLPPAPELRAWLRRRLPEAMVPGEVREVEALPLTPNGKVDRQALAALAALPAAGDAPAVAPPSGEAGSAGEVEELVAGIWREALGRERIGRHDNFFDLGGDSLKLMRVHDRLQSALDRELPIVELFEHPSLGDLAAHLSAGAPAPAAFPAAAAPGPLDRPAARSVAVLAAAGRFPGAQDVDELWRNLSAGIESISFFTAAQLAARGASPELLADPALVAARGVIADADCFDAAFFGFTPREAELMDPQHRVFLECAHAALEEAGCDPARYAGAIGVFAGSSSSSYLLHNLWPHPDLLRTAGDTLVRIGNDKDFLTSRVSYELGLRGPSVSVQTACSTSLVAVHLACQALLAGECDMALAGGVTVKVPQSAGHLYHSGGIGSPDGHCRAFAAEARGTVGGDGVGVVVLKRLDAALADGDPILGVILGSAVNNDGAAKPGYTAPGLAGQEAAIRAALAAAGVGPETVTYVEAHGTGTPLGDPVEIAALNRAFAAGGAAGPGRAGACAIGSVKTNLGHLDAAAGIAGLIKVLLALRHRQIPPSLHFTAPNPAIDFAGGHFRVSTELADWRPPAAGGRLRAGVSSFGIGGTNAHVVVEEPPPLAAASPGRRWQLLPLSARSTPALAAAAERLGRHLACHPELSLPDVAFTLQLGRGHFEHRRALVCSDPEAAARLLRADHRRRLHASSPAGEPVEPAVAFLFAGQAGGRRLELGRDLHAEDPVFRAELDRCAELLLPHLGLDLRQVLMPPPAEEAAAAALLGRTAIAQPALFAVEYALARTFMAWGIMPRAMLGHSLGEYVAACLAGVFSLADALSLIACRGRLMERMTGGAMLALPLTEEEVGPLLSPGLSLA
ncbi:MAG TPA: amino acid adenylation domain-containing protein, partial [Thermoanaerobaculia bacterium]|nr:amino acid adenylation domain-containing protein [Thermoanaerobaculia bacterium]